MILQALYDYYQRKAADPESHIAQRDSRQRPSRLERRGWCRAARC